MLIRPIELDDIEGFRETLDAVARERRYLLTLEAPPMERVEAFVKNNVERGYPQYVAEDDGRIIGWADFIPFVRESLAHTSQLGMGVLKEFRGKGIGDQLLRRVVTGAIDRGSVRLELEVFSNNLAAISLYRKHGFEYEGTKRSARLLDGEFFDINLMAMLVQR